MINTLLLLSGTTSIITIGATICILRKIKNININVSKDLTKYISHELNQLSINSLHILNVIKDLGQDKEILKAHIFDFLHRNVAKKEDQPEGDIGFLEQSNGYPNLNKETVGYPSIAASALGRDNIAYSKKKLSHYTKTQKKKLALKKEYSSLPAFLHLKKEMPIQKKWLFNTYTDVISHTFQNLPPTKTITIDEIWEIVKEHQKMDLIKERYSGHLPRKRVACQAYWAEKRIPHIHRIGKSTWARDEALTQIKKGYKNAISQ